MRDTAPHECVDAPPPYTEPGVPQESGHSDECKLYELVDAVERMHSDVSYLHSQKQDIVYIVQEAKRLRQLKCVLERDIRNLTMQFQMVTSGLIDY
eukprot:2001984-Rhodomonas_salina.1